MSSTDGPVTTVVGNTHEAEVLSALEAVAETVEAMWREALAEGDTAAIRLGIASQNLYAAAISLIPM